MAAATAMVYVYPDHPPCLLPSLLSFLFPFAESHMERALAAATAMISGYPDHPPILFTSLLSFLSPLAGSHRERG
ncbi:hypothetical protein RHGRI_001185 [Rhododendron griersonianum]|uniref:Uncharacterized protein n=1 Tax=Rhododendron griersonianum TaxID=479676 RepID=A0AAV6LLF2_9ERIC|nr:hypothetical protein RHGRI_001185 [Rhododendron griersonianum]